MNTRVEPGRQAGVLRTGRIELVDRLWQAAEAQVAAHEARLRGLAPGDAATEAHAKALATLARTLKELIELEAAALEAERAAEDGHPDDANPDAALDSLEALREELARRLAGLGAGGEGELDRQAEA